MRNMQTKLKTIVPDEKKMRLFDLLGLCSKFEIKIALSSSECTKYLANVLPYHNQKVRYIFQVPQNEALEVFILTRVISPGTSGIASEAELIGCLKEEPDLEVTTISGRIYPSIFAGYSSFLFAVIFYIIFTPSVHSPAFIIPVIFVIFSVLSLITVIKGKRILTAYFFSCLKPVLMASDPD